MEKLVESIEENFEFFHKCLQYCDDVEFRTLHPHTSCSVSLIKYFPTYVNLI
ncbi:hypothetical protein PMEGAPL103_23850 [Priestia megaterium]